MPWATQDANQLVPGDFLNPRGFAKTTPNMRILIFDISFHLKHDYREDDI
jgi:hypothetical protein